MEQITIDEILKTIAIVTDALYQEIEGEAE